MTSAMADGDVDIYGDLCGDLPFRSPAASPAPLLSPVPLPSPALQPSPAPSQQLDAPPSPAPLLAPPLPAGLPESKGPQTWVAPGYEHLAPRTGSVTSVIVEGGEVIAGSTDSEVIPAAPDPECEDDDEEALEPELLAVASAADRNSLRSRRRNDPRTNVVEAAPGKAPPQPLRGADPSSACTQFLLLGGLPPGLPEAELRRLSEQFGELNAIRVLEDAATGKPVGIALLEYAAAESAARAAGVGNGLCALSAWPIMTVAPPRLVLVGRELLNMLRAASPPWTEGGHCSEDLRCVLLRQFEQWGLYMRQELRSGDASPTRQLSRQGSALSLTRSNSRGESPERPRRDESWTDKLNALKRKVNQNSGGGDAKRERI